MKKILLIGSGAREHAVASAFKKGKEEVELYVVGSAKNPGIFGVAKEYLIADVCDKEAIKKFALSVKPDFAFIGPEAPIDAGITDILEEIGVKCASPLRVVGQLECSKSFTRNLLAKYSIPGSPKFRVFSNSEGLKEFLEELGGEYVVKADGLKGGKGVKVSGEHLKNIEEGFAYAESCIKEAGKVVIEEKLVGQEFSLMSFCDGISTSDMPLVQDHKRAFEGDKGPNTGGMGTYSCEDHLLPFLTDEDRKKASEINKMVAKALYEETGVYFKGIMYGGFMATKDGVGLIEYNVRFGDPEVMNVLPILKTDFVKICETMIKGSLDKMEVEFEKKATVCKYLVPLGYPDDPKKGEKIVVKEIPEGVLAYYGSVNEKEDGLYLSGSRAIAFVGIAENLEGAEKLAQSAVSSVAGPVFYRKDIGTKELIEKRVMMMKKLREN